jgi:hypothetical protein
MSAARSVAWLLAFVVAVTFDVSLYSVMYGPAIP